MVKQRQDSITVHRCRSRRPASKEQAELAIIGEHMPAALSEEELKELVSKALAEAGAQSIKDMGKDGRASSGSSRPSRHGRSRAQVKQALGSL